MFRKAAARCSEGLLLGVPNDADMVSGIGVTRVCQLTIVYLRTYTYCDTSPPLK